MDRVLSAETIEAYERRVEEIEADRKRASTMEHFERRIEKLEAQIKPQLDELHALKAGLSRLRERAGSESAIASGASNGRAHASTARSTPRQTPSPRRRR